MLPAPLGFLAVPGRILPIPGTEYVVITPDWGRHQDDATGEARDTNSNSVLKLDQKGKEQNVTQPRPTTSGNDNDNVDSDEQDRIDALPSITRRGRGRPPKGRSLSPCQCPNCKIKPNSDRHLCHFANCGMTFTKKNHLQAHIRKHLGTRPFACPQQSCDASFTRQEELTRHYWLHSDEPRFQCQWCDRKFNRVDHYKGHERQCASKSTGGLVQVLIEMEQEDDARADQESQGAEEIDPAGVKEDEEEIEPQGVKEDEEVLPRNIEKALNSKKCDPINISDEDCEQAIIISDEDNELATR